MVLNVSRIIAEVLRGTCCTEMEFLTFAVGHPTENPAGSVLGLGAGYTPFFFHHFPESEPVTPTSTEPGPNLCCRCVPSCDLFHVTTAPSKCVPLVGDTPPTCPSLHLLAKTTSYRVGDRARVTTTATSPVLAVLRATRGSARQKRRVSSGKGKVDSCPKVVV